jgi:uncharacterized repeat protein (TIGR02543 family)
MNKWILMLFLVILSFFIVACDDKPELDIVGLDIDETLYELPLMIGDYDLSDFKIIVEYEDGTTKNVTIKESMIQSELLNFYLVEGTHEVTVLYESFSISFTVTMIAPQDTFTITFETNEGNLINPIAQAKYTLIVWPEDPTKEGFVFAGWYSDGTLETEFTSNQMPDEDITLYAKWNVLWLTVTFMIDSNEVYSEEIVPYGSSLTPDNDLIKEGHTFIGWDQAVDQIKTDLVVYAVFEVNTYTITFETFEGELVDPLDLLFGTEIEKLEDTSKEGYIFENWYLDQDFTIPFELEFMPAFDIILYANFVLPTATISFETFGGTTIEPLTQVVGSSITPPLEPEKFGYAFEGWFMDETYMSPYAFDIMPETSIIIYAKWEDLELDPLNFLSMTPSTTIESQVALTNYVAYMMFHQLDEVELTIDYTFAEGNEIVQELQAALHMSHKHINTLSNLSYSYNPNNRRLVLIPTFAEEALLSASDKDAFVQRPFYDMNEVGSRDQNFNDFNIPDLRRCSVKFDISQISVKFFNFHIGFIHFNIKS